MYGKGLSGALLAVTMVGVLPFLMGYQPDVEPPPPPPPPPPPDTSIDEPGSKDDVIPITGDSAEPPPENPDVIPIKGDGWNWQTDAGGNVAFKNGTTLPADLTGLADVAIADFAAPVAGVEAATARPSWLIPAVVAGVVLLAAIGFAVTRPSSEPSAAPTTTSRPTTAPLGTAVATVPAASAVRVTDSKLVEQGNVCRNPTTLTFVIQVTGAKAGDAVHLKLAGPGLPSALDGTPLDASGGSSTVIGTVGPVKGNQQWAAQVDQIAGQPIVSGSSQVFGFCPAN